MKTLIFSAIITLVQCLVHNPDLSILQHPGNYSTIMQFSFNESSEHVLVFPTSQSMYPYRVKVWSADAKWRLPVLVVVRQEREVLSWQVPFSVESSSGRHLYFHNTSRTLCHNNMPQITEHSKLKKSTIKNVATNLP